MQQDDCQSDPNTVSMPATNRKSRVAILRRRRSDGEIESGGIISGTLT